MRSILLSASLLAASACLSQAAVLGFSKTSHVTITIEQPAKEGDIKNVELMKKGSACANPCGWLGQVCCKLGETCTTNVGGQPVCLQGEGKAAAVTQNSGSGSWQYYTSTWDVTMTSVYSTWVGGGGGAPQPTGSSNAQTCVPNFANGESPCGGICCAANQYCFASGTCTAMNGFTTAGVGPGPGPAASGPLRGTSVTGVIVTETVSPTTTMPFSTPVGTGESQTNGTIIPMTNHHHLSPGAIAGIVIGVLFAIIILIVICLFCCLKAGFDAILGLFGRGKDRRESHMVEEEIIEHRRHGRQSAAASADGRRWYGSGYERQSRPAGSRHSSQNKKKKGGFGGIGALGAGLGGLALALGLKRRADDKKKRREEEKSNVSYSYYDSEYSSYDSVSTYQILQNHPRVQETNLLPLTGSDRSQDRRQDNRRDDRRDDRRSDYRSQERRSDRIVRSGPSGRSGSRSRR